MPLTWPCLNGNDWYIEQAEIDILLVSVKVETEGIEIMNPDQRSELLRKAPLNSWVALSEDETRIVSHGKTYAEAVANAERAGEHEPVLLKTPDDWLPIVV